MKTRWHVATIARKNVLGIFNKESNMWEYLVVYRDRKKKRQTMIVKGYGMPQATRAAAEIMGVVWSFDSITLIEGGIN